MKINELLNRQLIGGKEGKPGQASSGLDFRQMLESRLQAVQGSEMAPAVRPTGAASMVDPALRVEGLALTETALDTLEAYSQALGNRNFNSRDLEPYVAALEEESTGLQDIRAQMPGDDPLGKLLEQVATVTFLETAKFRRGDYDA